MQNRVNFFVLPIDEGRGDDFPGKPRLMLRLIATVLLVLGFATPFSLSALAEPLGADECKTLQSKKQTLLTKTVRAALTRGPDWVKEHLHDQEQIEKVRAYLEVEEKVAFRCRTDGVRIPKRLPPPLPDRKPPVPTYVAEGEAQKVLAGMAATSLLPLRKPTREAPQTIEAVLAADEEAAGDGEPAEEAPASAADETPKPGSSQAVAESDKTAPPDNKATP